MENKDIFDGKYNISENGDVWSYFKDRYLKAVPHPNGHLKIFLYPEVQKPVNYILARLVAKHFVKNPHPKKWKKVKYKDGDLTNCGAKNLYWSK
jgi:hypothetical protein